MYMYTDKLYSLRLIQYNTIQSGSKRYQKGILYSGFKKLSIPWKVIRIKVIWIGNGLDTHEYYVDTAYITIPKNFQTVIVHLISG